MPDSQGPNYSPSTEPVPLNPAGGASITPELLVGVLGLARIAELAAEPHPTLPEGALWLSTPGAVAIMVAALRDGELRALATAMGLSTEGTTIEVFRRLVVFV